MDQFPCHCYLCLKPEFNGDVVGVAETNQTLVPACPEASVVVKHLSSKEAIQVLQNTLLKWFCISSCCSYCDVYGLKSLLR